MFVTYYNPPNGTREWNLTIEDRTIGLFMNNTWQTVYLIESSYPLESVKIDDDGNPIAVLRFPKSRLSPGESVSYNVTYHVISSPRQTLNITEEEALSLEAIPQEFREKYCKEEGPWLIDDPRLRRLAYDIMGNETRVLVIVKKFVKWISDPKNVRYPAERHEVPQYPNETLASGEGDCDDKAILLITLCRICGIPAYLQIGCIYIGGRSLLNETYWDGHVTSVLRRIGWHGWAMVYIPPWGWLPVDLTYVPDGLADPLNAIRRGAVTLQETIQYMNITKTDYVKSSRETRELLILNDFYIYMEDEMIEEEEAWKKSECPRDLLDLFVEDWIRWILIIVAIVTIAATVTYLKRKGMRRVWSDLS